MYTVLGPTPSLLDISTSVRMATFGDASPSRKRRSMTLSVVSTESGRRHEVDSMTFSRTSPRSRTISQDHVLHSRSASRNDARARLDGTASADGSVQLPSVSIRLNAATVDEVGAEPDSEDEAPVVVGDALERPVLDHAEMPRTATSDLAAFLKTTGPPAAASRSSFAHDSRPSSTVPGSGHFLWDEPPPLPRKRGIFSRAKNAVGLRRQRSEHNITVEDIAVAAALGLDKQHEFDAQLRAENVTKRVLPSGLSYYTTSSVTTASEAETGDTNDASNAQSAAVTPVVQSTRSRHRSKLSSGISLPSSSSLKLRGIGGRATSMSSFADPSVRPVSSHGNAALPTSGTFQRLPDPSQSRKSAPPARSNSQRGSKGKLARSNSGSSPGIPVPESSTQATGRVSLADMRGSKDRSHDSPAMSQLSVATAPPGMRDSLQPNSSHGRAPSRAESRASLKTFMSMKGDFPGLIARAASAMSNTSALPPCPSPIPPLPLKPAENEAETVYNSAVASPTPSTVSGSMWQRNSAMFVPVTVDDVEMQRTSSTDRQTSMPPSPLMSASLREPPTCSLEILRPSDFAVPAAPDREHARSKSRSSSQPFNEVRSETASTSKMLMLPAHPSGGKGGAQQSIARARSREEPELRQGWVMPRDFEAVKAARSASALSQNSDIEIVEGAEPLPHPGQRALSPPSRKRSGRTHSRADSFESLRIARTSVDATPSKVIPLRTGLTKAQLADLDATAELEASWDTATPTVRASPLRNTIALSESGPSGASRKRPTSTDARAALLPTSRKRPISVCSTKSGGGQESNQSGGTATIQRSNSTRVPALSLSQVSPSASLELDAPGVGKFGLGLRTSSVLAAAFGDAVNEAGVRSRTTSAGTESMRGALPAPAAAIEMAGPKTSTGTDEDSMLSPTSPAAMLWGALEAMRAEFMISELRAEQERARFRLLARQSVDVLERTVGGSSPAAGPKSSGDQGKKARATRTGTSARRSGQLPAKSKAGSVERRRAKRRHAERRRQTRDRQALETVLAQLRLYGTSSSSRVGSAASRASASMIAQDGQERASLGTEAEWVDAMDGDEDDAVAPTTTEPQPQKEEAATAEESREPSSVMLHRARQSADRLASYSFADEEEDDVSSQQTDGSVDFSRETMSQATTLEDFTAVGSMESPPRSKAHHSNSLSEAEASELAASAASEESARRGSFGGEEGETTFASFRFSDSPMSPGTFGNLSEIADAAGGPRPQARLGLHLDMLASSPPPPPSSSNQLQLALGRSPVLMQSPRSFGTISEDGAFEHGSMSGEERELFAGDSGDSADSGTFPPISYGETGPFGSVISGSLFSLRAQSGVAQRGGGGGGGGLSLRRSRRCESMSTIVSEDARSELGSAGLGCGAAEAGAEEQELLADGALQHVRASSGPVPVRLGGGSGGGGKAPFRHGLGHSSSSSTSSLVPSPSSPSFGPGVRAKGGAGGSKLRPHTSSGASPRTGAASAGGPRPAKRRPGTDDGRSLAGSSRLHALSATGSFLADL